MADTSRVFGAFKNKARWLQEIGKTLVSAITILLLIVLGYIAWQHFHSKKGTRIAGPSQVESIDKTSTDNFLKNNDLASYQVSQQSLAQQYLLNNDPTNAERIIKEVISKLPEDKITSGTYMVITSAEKAKNDKTQYKYYLGLLITKLKQENKPTLAAVYQKELDKQ